MKKLLTILLMFIYGYSYSQFYVPSGTTIFTTSTEELTSKENVVNNGTIYSIDMNKASAQTLSGTGILRYLKANNSADISLLSPQYVTNNGITLTAGKMVIGNYNLTAASVTNDDASRYIKTNGTGLFRMNAATGDYTNYPVGNSVLNYVRIYNNNVSADTFALRVQDVLYANAGTGVGSLNNAVNRTWYITKTTANGGSGVNLEFNWNSGDVNGTLSNAALYEYNGSKWEKSSGTQSVSGNQLTITGYTGTLSDKMFMVASALSAQVAVATSACQDATAVNATFTGSNGTAPYTFTYTVNGGSNQTVSTTSGNSVTVAVNTASSGNQVYVLVSVEDASQQNIASGTATIAINANLPVTVSIASSDADNTICAGSSVTFTASPTNGGSSPAYQWKLNGAEVGTNQDTYTNTSLANADIVSVELTSNATPCAMGNPATSNTITTIVTALGTWIGTNGNWSDAANWSCGVVPTAGTTIVIESGNPILDVDYTVSGSLTLSGAATLTISPLKTLTISGAVDFGGKLVTVKSDINGTGSIGQITGTLTGATNVTVERYIPDNTFRSWRLLSVPTYGNGQTINGAWQEGNIPLENNTPGYGTQITSPSGIGFDDVSPNPSMYKYNGTALEAISNTGDAIATNQGYFLYVRGDRTVGMSSSTTSATATTLRTNGTLYKGTQTSATILANNYGLVGNPFVSAINFTSLTRTGGVTNAFYIWDAKKLSGNSLGLYQTFSNTNSFQCLVSGGSYVFNSTGNTTIQSGQAFFVYADGAEGTVTIPESSKVASSGTLGYKNVSELVKIDSRLYSIVGATTTMADANVVVFDAAYSNAVDRDDAIKFSNDGENFGILKSSKILAIEGRQPVTAVDTIFFKIWNMQPHAYQLELIPQNLGTQNLVAKLEDSYLNTSTVVNLEDTNRINFAVDATPASYASNRFRIVFTPGVVLPVNFISIAASRKTTTVQVNWKVGNELNIHHYEVERSTDGSNYSKAGTIAATGITDYSLLDANAPAVSLFYRVKSVGIAGEIKYSAVVKVAAENVKPGYAVVPNPIEGREINIQFKNQAGGKYSIKLLSNAGQQISSTEVNHVGGNGTQTIQIPAGLARGTYQLEIISADKTSSTQSIFINNK
jgi:hypothetical protein